MTHSLGCRALRLSVAEMEAGVREFPAGSNDGPKIRLYRAGAWRHGLPLAAGPGPWCAYAACWSAEVAWQEMPLDAPHPPHGWRASVYELVTDARAADAWRPAGAGYQPQPGDLAVFARDGQSPLTGGAGHVGRVESSTVDTVTSIDGNVGDRWARVTRPLAEVLGWIAYPLRV